MELIDWTCETCRAGTNGRGALHIFYRDLIAAEEAKKAWDRRDRMAGTQFSRSHEPEELMAPAPALWKVECHSCAGVCEDSYWIDLTQVRTMAGLEQWTEHLERKSWFAATNWPMVMASVAERMAV